LLEAYVCADLDALITALYVTIDDLLAPRRGPGRRPRTSDAELVCLAVLQVLLGYPSERHFLRYAHAHLRGLFPRLPGQSGYNRRLRRLTPRLQQVLHHLAVTSPSWCDQVRLLDSTPIPCAASRQTVDRSALGPYAAYGYCRAHSRWFWGVRLMLLAAPDGMPIAYCLAPANRPERQVAAMLLARTPVTGQLLIGDKGFAGRAFAAEIAALGARFIRPDRRDEPPRVGQLGWIRQRIESIFDTLKAQLSLERHGGRTPQGLFTRVTQRLLALAACIWRNWQLSQPHRSLIAYDH
jgi:Transposase DDE domain